jgi:hypothetical protein
VESPRSKSSEKILPPKMTVPKQQPAEINDWIVNADENRQRKDNVDSRKTTAKTTSIGLTALLEEIGVSDAYKRQTSAEGHRDRQIRQVSQDSSNQAHRPAVEKQREMRDHRRRQIPRDSARVTRNSWRESDSAESYAGQKLAEFDHYERKAESRKTSRLRPVSGIGAPSPGEGVRNALGNLENRMGRRQSRTSKQSNRKIWHDDVNRRTGAGLSTLIEELAKPEERTRLNGICFRLSVSNNQEIKIQS